MMVYGLAIWRGILEVLSLLLQKYIKAFRPQLETTQNKYIMINYSGVHLWTSSGLSDQFYITLIEGPIKIQNRASGTEG